MNQPMNCITGRYMKHGFELQMPQFTYVTDALVKCISLHHMKQFTQVGLQ